MRVGLSGASAKSGLPDVASRSIDDGAKVTRKQQQVRRRPVVLDSRRLCRTDFAPNESWVVGSFGEVWPARRSLPEYRRRGEGHAQTTTGPTSPCRLRLQEAMSDRLRP